METPPRAWGRLELMKHKEEQMGNTPTGVGKTRLVPGINSLSGKHPHGRGEDLVKQAEKLTVVETPPRAWGRPPRPAP